MSKRDILRQYSEFKKLFTFLTCFFGDYWEGKTTEDLMIEVIKESPDEYLAAIHNQIQKFISAPLPIKVKRDIIYANNIYYETDEEAVEWLNIISMLLETHLKK